MRQIARRLDLLPARSVAEQKKSFERFMEIQRLKKKIKKLRGDQPESVVYPSRRCDGAIEQNRPMQPPKYGFKLALWVQQNGRCRYCCGSLLPRYHVDHIHPKSKGGANHPSNYCLACQPCNLAKKDKSAESFMLSLLQKSRMRRLSYLA